VGTVRDTVFNPAGTDVAFVTMATQSLAEAAVTGHISGIDPRIIVFFPPLDDYALLGNLVICLSGQVTLTLGAIETTDRN
jgi:hypothetical protein